MTDEEMLAYAKSVVDGGPVRKIEVQAFLKAFLQRTQIGYLPAQAKPTAPEVTLPHMPFVIEKTDTGIHVPRDANRFYTRAEAAALIHAISKALET